MKTHFLTLFLCVCALLPKMASSQSYSFTSFDQSVSVNGDPLATNVNTLSTCSEYVFNYNIGFGSTTISSVTDDISFELPLNVSFQSLLSSNGTVTVNSSSGNTVSLHLSGWNISNVLNIKLIGISSSCDASSVTGNPLAELDGNLASASVNSPNGVTIVSPQLIVDDLGGNTMKNIGDVDEMVFKIQNTGGNGTVIQNLLVDYVLNSNIESYLNTYYISASPTQGTGNNIYTYTLPGGVFTSTIPTGTIPIDPADFQNVLGHGYLANNEVIYLHIPFFVNSCGGTTGSFTFKRNCGNSVTCDNVEIEHNISVFSGNTYIGANNVIGIAPNQIGTFCATAGGQSSTLDWKFYGSNSNPTGGPAGYTRATDIQLLVLVDNSFGSVVPNSFTISNGLNVIDVSAVTTIVNTSFPMLGTPTTGTLYKIDLSQLSVSSAGNWQPLGVNSLSDLDGDGNVDDLIEFGSFEIHADYVYNTTCPLYSDHGAYYTSATLEWYYKNACGVPVNNSAYAGNFSWYVDASTLGYTATGAGGELTLPPDVLSTEPFISELCFAPYYENYSLNGFGFDCPDGFHRVIYEVPHGYHLDVSGLTASSTPGWYELPDMTVTSVAGTNNPTAQVSPIVQEYCNPSGTGRIIEVRFGLIPWDLYFFARPTTMLLPCLNLPMYLDCGTSDPACPGLPNNFGFDDLEFRLEYVCDETCNTCSAFIVGGHASTYHHCPGLCTSYFGTDPHPEFERSSLGFVNTTSGYIMGDDLTLASNLTSSTEPAIDLASAYPGDQISVKVNGGFNGTPGSSYTPNTGASYNDMYLQIRYDDLPTGDRKEARLFDFEQLSGDGITITETSPVNGVSSFTMPASTLTMTNSVSGGIVSLNINFSSAGLGFIDESNAVYTFSSDLHLRVRSEPFSSGYNYFFSSGKHVITSLRFEYKGTETDGVTIDGSCDDYGANFRILQPSARGPEGVYIGEPTYCGLSEVYFRFYNDAALFQIANDFPNEYRGYGQLNPELAVTIPAGYQFVGAHFVQDRKEFNSTLTNNFGPDYEFPRVDLPMTPSGPNTFDINGNTVVHFQGLSPTEPFWPALDLEYLTGSQYIYFQLVPDCDVPVHSDIYVAGDYTLGVNQNLATYQHEFAFTTQIPLGHYNPNINIVNPVATVNAFDGTAEFTFSVCNEVLTMTGPANAAWFAFENSAVDGLDLTNATLINLQTNLPVSFTTYTDANLHQAIIVNYGLINPQSCVNFKLITHVSPNGCVNGNTSVADFLTAYGGNSCDGSILSAPVEECTNEITQFAFNRYPSDLELILPSNAYPTNPVEMCNGILEYNFVLNSYEVGGVSDVEFWLDLPSGLSLNEITFSNPAGSPTSATLTSFDGNTYGSGGNLSGWDVLSHLGMSYLPGSMSTNHEIFVHLEVQSSCDYNLTSPVLCYANSMNSCSQQTDLLEMSSLPMISNVTLANDLVITPVITFSDSIDTLSCNNTATVTLTITNNSSVSNLTDLELITQVPGSPLIVDPGTGTLSGNEVVWNLPANTIPANSTTTVIYTINNPGVICQNDLPMWAVIQFSQDVNCTSTGGSCDVNLNTDTVYFDIDVCCNCDLVVETTSEPKHCKFAGSATANVTGGSGSYTYLWSDGQTTSTAINLVPGTYTVTVTDEEGCTETVTVTVGDISGEIVITATPDLYSVCPGESVSITPGGASGYNLTDGGSTTMNSTGSPFIVTPTTTTTYTVYGTDEFGCSGDTTITITVIPLDTPSFHIAHTYCYGTTIPVLPAASLNNITGTWSPATISNTASGTYIFTPDAGQCATTFTLNVTINPLPTITVNSATICVGQSATLTASGASSYSWSPTGTLSSGTGATVTATPSSTTTYTVTGISADGCYGTATSTVTVDSIETPTFNAVGPYCRGASIPALPTTSTNGISGSWSPAIDNVHTTTYTFTPTAGQCASTTTLTITIIPNVLPTFTAVGPYCSGASIPALPTTSTNTPGITGTWSPAINNTATTTYTFTPTAGQCAVTTEMTITISPANTIAAGVNRTTCINTAITAITLSTTGATGATFSGLPAGVTGSWSGNVVTISGTPTVSGTFNYTVTTTGGCPPATATGTIYVNPANTITQTSYDATNPQTVCRNSSIANITFAITGATGVNVTGLPAGVTWSLSGNVVTISGTPTVAGTFNYTVTTTGGCPPATASGTINVTPTNTITLTSAAGTNAQTVCKSSPITNITYAVTGATGVNVTGLPTGVTWSFAGNVVTITGSPSVSGTFNYTITTTGGCPPATATGSITVTAPPSISITNSNQVICDGELPASSTLTAVVTPSTGVTYSWNPGGATTSSITVTPTLGTTQTYIVTASVGGCTVTSSTTVGYYKLPSVSVTPTASTICSGQSVSLSASGTAGSTYSWSPSGTLSSPVGTPVTATPTATTTYFVTASLNGCTNTASSTITVNPTPTISGPTSVCTAGGTVTLTGNPTGGTWSSLYPSIASINSTTGVITPSATASGPVPITYTLSTGCSKTYNFTVNPLPAAPTISGPTTICDGDYATLNVTNYTSGIVWTPGSTASPSISVGAPASPTTYTATYTNPTTGCTKSSSISVSKVSCSQPSHCFLTANFAYTLNNCNWTFTSTSSNVVGTIPSPGTGYTFNWTISVVSTGAVVYTTTGYSFTTPVGIWSGWGNYRVCLTVTKTGSNPVCQDQVCKIIYVNCDNALVLSTSSAGLNSKFETKGIDNTSLDDLNYWWSFGDGTFSTEAKPEHKYAKAGSYEVCMKVGYGDLDELPNSVCRTIDVTADEVETGVVPILSVNPNPTGGQTTVVIDGTEGKTVEVKVFNLLGDEVTTLFTKTCCNDEMIRLVWNAQDVPPGVYLIKAQVDSKMMIEKIVVSSH